MSFRSAASAGALAVAVAATLPASASATPSTGLTGTILARATIGGTDYVLREIVAAPGASTGWHHHDGPVYAVVRSGTMHHYEASCRLDHLLGPGGTIAEPDGPSYIHLGRNLGPGPLVLEVLYVLPAGSPLAEDEPNPGCAFS